MATLNGQKVNNAGMWDPSTMIAAGMNPKTGLPYKLDNYDCALKDDIKRALRIVDEQDAINRYTWYNLPDGLSGQMIERILYYRGQGMFFYMPTIGKFYFLPYTLEGNLDVYGRYTGVTPLPFTGSIDSDEKGKDKPWIQGLVRKPLYEILPEVGDEDLETYCVLLSDYSKQWAQTIIPRYRLQDSILDVMSDCIPYCRTALLNSTGIMGVRVNSGDEYSAVEDASKAIDKAAKAGRKFVPMLGQIDFQALTDGPTGRTEEFMLAMQSFDNFRLSLYGLENGGLFEKKAQELQADSLINSHKATRTYQDGLTNRQTFCDLVNSFTGLGVSCEPSETEQGDMNYDGFGYDDQDQSGAMEGAQPDMQEVEENV